MDKDTELTDVSLEDAYPCWVSQILVWLQKNPVLQRTSQTAITPFVDLKGLLPVIIFLLYCRRQHSWNEINMCFMPYYLHIS